MPIRPESRFDFSTVEQQQCHDGPNGSPAEAASGRPCLALVPTGRPLDCANVDDVGLALVDQEGAIARSIAENIDPPTKPAGANLDLVAHVPSQPQEPSTDVPACPCMYGIRLPSVSVDDRELGSQFGSYAKRIEQPGDGIDRDRHGLAAFEPRNERLRQAGSSRESSLRPAERRPSPDDGSHSCLAQLAREDRHARFVLARPARRLT